MCRPAPATSYSFPRRPTKPMLRILLTTIALALMSSGACADYLLLLDPTRLDAAVVTRGAGPDGRQVRPRAVAAACIRDGVLGPAAFSPRFDRCRAAAAVPGLRDAVAELPVAGAEPGTTVIGLVNAGGIIAVEPRRGLACLPGDCNRDVFEGATYPTSLVGSAGSAAAARPADRAVDDRSRGAHRRRVRDPVVGGRRRRQLQSCDERKRRLLDSPGVRRASCSPSRERGLDIDLLGARRHRRGASGRDRDLPLESARDHLFSRRRATTCR